MILKKNYCNFIKQMSTDVTVYDTHNDNDNNDTFV